MTNKSSKEQGSLSPRLVTSNLVILSPNSVSSYSSIDKKFQGDNKVHKSLKYKNSVIQIKIEEKVEKSDVAKKGKAYNNGGNNRSNKLSESYYCHTKGSIGQDQRITSLREKDQELQLKYRSHNQPTSSKRIKSKLCLSRKVEKVKTESNPEVRSFSNRQSLQRLISINSNSGSISKMKIVHTFSPDGDPIFEKLAKKRKDKILGVEENEIFLRMHKVLCEYEEKIIREEKERDDLIKENKKEKEKLEGKSSSKRYTKVYEYNL